VGWGPKLEEKECDIVPSLRAAIDENGTMIDWQLGGETDKARENLPQCHFDNHASYIKILEIEPELPR
jgi:hypothetical protein